MTNEHLKLLSEIDINNEDISDTQTLLKELLMKDKELHLELLKHEAKTDYEPGS